ncbi:hypothetical protein AB6D11_00540 [Vibrio splendidus]
MHKSDPVMISMLLMEHSLSGLSKVAKIDDMSQAEAELKNKILLGNYQLRKILNGKPKTLEFSEECGPLGEFSLIGEYSALYGRSQCAWLAQGLYDALEDTFNPQGVMVKDEKGEVVHWLVQVEHVGQTYFLDSFGIYTDHDHLKVRYPTTNIESVETFSFTDDDLITESLNNMFCNDIDMMEGLMEDAFPDIEFCMADVCDRHDFYMKSIGQNHLAILDSLLQPNKELNPSP